MTVKVSDLFKNTKSYCFATVDNISIIHQRNCQSGISDVDSFHYTRSLLRCKFNFKEQTQVVDLLRILATL